MAMPSGCAASSGSVAKVVAGVRVQASATPPTHATTTRHSGRARARCVMTDLLASLGEEGSAQRARCAQACDAGRVVVQQRPQDFFGVLAERGRRGEVG